MSGLNENKELKVLREIIASDTVVISFQNMAQYRQYLVNLIDVMLNGEANGYIEPTE